MSCDLNAEISTGLHTRWLGKEIIHLATTDSTNDVARRAAIEGHPQGLVVLAEEQTRGHGRLGRDWHAPSGTSILMSILLRPIIPLAQTFSLTMLAGSAASAAIERVAGLRCDLKWPNDVQVAGKKLGGILTEASFGAEGLDFAVVGLGINVDVDFTDVPLLKDSAISLRAQLGYSVPRALLIQAILEEFERRYEAVQRGEYTAIFAEWRDRLATLGKEVFVTDGQWREPGLASGVDLDGTLLLRRADGTTIRVVTGDVSLRETT